MRRFFDNVRNVGKETWPPARTGNPVTNDDLATPGDHTGKIRRRKSRAATRPILRPRLSIRPHLRPSRLPPSPRPESGL